jgi:hypothetical protein
MYIAKSTLGSHIPLRLNLEKDIANAVILFFASLLLMRFRMVFLVV